MSLQHRNTPLSRQTRLALEQFSDRLAPAVYTWVGQLGNGFEDWTNELFWSKAGDNSPGDDGYPGGPGHANDTPKFDTLAANFRAPKIYGGTAITVNDIEVTSNWNRDIAVDGTLKVYASSMNGSGSLAGDGYFLCTCLALL